MKMRFPGFLRKAVTLSYDDVVEQDEQMIPILDKYGVRCTFNINSGLYAKEGTTYPAGQIHRRLSLSRAKALYHDRHEIATHCLTHLSLTEAPQSVMIYEIIRDRENLERDFGGIIRGFAYPFGTLNDAAVGALAACGIAYARTVRSSHSFEVPQDWLRLDPTCHHNDPRLMELCDQFLKDPAPFSSKLFYLWGHSYEFERDDNWEVLTAFCEKMSGRDDIWYATNIEIVDYVNAYRALRFSADTNKVFNPTCMQVWFERDGMNYTVLPGETITLRPVGQYD